jgi:hypothetical protein
MICPYCEKEGVESILSTKGETYCPGGDVSITYDNKMNLKHRHDPGTLVSEWNCPNNHSFVLKQTIWCPATECKYGMKGDIFEEKK